MKQAIQEQNNSSGTVLYLAIETSKRSWKICMSAGRKKFSEKSITAGDMGALQEAIKRAKKRLELSPDAQVYSCYEAGRDAFWIHRELERNGITNIIVDAASIEVPRRKRRKKTDRIDARKLKDMLVRYYNGEEDVWGVVRVPSIEAEDGYRAHRELECLKRERTKHMNRIRSLLTTQGVEIKIGSHFKEQLKQIRLRDGRPLPVALEADVLRQYERYTLVEKQIREIDLERKRRVLNPQTRADQQVAELMKLKAIGLNSSWLFVYEFFSWREFKNRKQVGSLSGLTGTPYNTGDSDREQGISKAGNRRVRSMAVEIAWCWLRWQPDSHLSHWFQLRFGGGGSRIRRIGIVALARKLLIALWRYLGQGIIPEGAQLKPEHQMVL
jgi:transposase